MAFLAPISGSLPPVNVGATAAINTTNRLLAANLGQSSLGLSGGGSAVVELSRFGQVLSAATTFQSELSALRPGTANSGGGQNFGTDEASLAAEVQSFVDSFNDFQRALSGRNDGFGGLGLGGNVPGAAGLAQALAIRVPGTFENGDSELTRLAQLGIVQQADPLSGGVTLSVDLGQLQAAFAADAPGAFSLLTQAAEEFGALAGDFAAQPGVDSFAINTLTQSLVTNALLGSSGLLFGRSASSVGFADLLVLDALLQGESSSFNLQQRVLATTQFALIGSLLE